MIFTQSSRAGRTLVLLLFLFSAPAFAARWPGRVAVPVADVRAASGSLPNSFDYDPRQETQLLYGDPVLVLEESGDWLKIEAPGQKEFSHANQWGGYPGWVLRGAIVRSPRIPSRTWVMVRRKSSRLYASPDASSAVFPLSMGTRFPAFDEVVNGFRKVRTGAKTFAWVPEQDLRLLKILPQAEARKTILESASELIGDPYFWGGASANLPDLKGHMTAVDCSGLVYLAYRVAGIDIPRDSLEQSMKARPVKKERLKPGDLIFSAPKDHPEKITHVALFVDEKTMIEAPKTGEKVRKVSFQDKYGVPFDQVEEGKVLGDRVIRFGTYFENR